jgi:hypothetical protein
MKALSPFLIVFFLSFASLAWAGQTDWGNLRGLKPDQKIKVIEANGRKVTGIFLSVSDSALLIRDSDGEMSIPKSEVRSVTLQNHRRLRNTLIGTGVGAAAGAAIGAATTPSDGWFSSKGFGAAAGGVFFGLVGTAAGAVLPTHNGVYKSASR